MGGIAEFERELIRKRCLVGIERARANGTKFGRPVKLDACERRKIAERYATGETMEALARDYGCGHSTISRVWRGDLTPSTHLLFDRQRVLEEQSRPGKVAWSCSTMARWSRIAAVPECSGPSTFPLIASARTQPAAKETGRLPCPITVTSNIPPIT
jgi:transposase-like protein